MECLNCSSGSSKVIEKREINPIGLLEGDIYYHYYLKCTNCGYEFVNNRISEKNLISKRNKKWIYYLKLEELVLRSLGFK